MINSLSIIYTDRFHCLVIQLQSHTKNIQFYFQQLKLHYFYVINNLLLKFFKTLLRINVIINRILNKYLFFN